MEDVSNTGLDIKMQMERKKFLNSENYMLTYRNVFFSYNYVYIITNK